MGLVKAWSPWFGYMDTEFSTYQVDEWLARLVNISPSGLEIAVKGKQNLTIGGSMVLKRGS